MKYYTKKLPDTLSELLKVALEDLQACEDDPKYKVNMLSWHTPTNNKTCYVCLAGSVMAKTCNVPLDRTATPRDFLEGHKLDALDFLRRGQVEMAVSTFYGNESWGEIAALERHSLPLRSVEHTYFLRQMEKIFELLTKHNL